MSLLLAVQVFAALGLAALSLLSCFDPTLSYPRWKSVLHHDDAYWMWHWYKQAQRQGPREILNDVGTLLKIIDAARLDETALQILILIAEVDASKLFQTPYILRACMNGKSGTKLLALLVPECGNAREWFYRSFCQMHYPPEIVRACVDNDMTYLLAHADANMLTTTLITDTAMRNGNRGAEFFIQLAQDPEVARSMFLRRDIMKHAVRYPLILNAIANNVNGEVIAWKMVNAVGKELAHQVEHALMCLYHYQVPIPRMYNALNVVNVNYPKYPTVRDDGTCTFQKIDARQNVLAVLGVPILRNCDGDNACMLRVLSFLVKNPYRMYTRRFLAIPL